MKTLKALNSLMAAIVVVALASGCASTGYQKADKTGASIADFHNEVVNVKKAVDNTMALLNQTTETAATDPRKARRAKMEAPSPCGGPNHGRNFLGMGVWG